MEDSNEQNQMPTNPPPGEPSINSSSTYVAWTPDAESLIGSIKNKDLGALQLVEVQNLQKFNLDGVRLITATRGNGKSICLARRAVQLSSEIPDIHFLQSRHPYVNQLKQLGIAIPNSQVGNLCAKERWAVLWQLTFVSHFACMYLRSKGLGTNNISPAEAIKNHFKLEARRVSVDAFHGPDFLMELWSIFQSKFDNICWAMTYLIERAPSLNEMNALIEQLDLKVLQNSSSKLTFAMFVDRVDEALFFKEESLFALSASGIAGSPAEATVTDVSDAVRRSETLHRRSLRSKVIVAAQLGFLKATQKENFDGSFRIYGAMRKEPIDAITDEDYGKFFGTNQTKFKTSFHALIDYKTDELKLILELNVKWTKPRFRFDSDINAPDTLATLFGFNEITHRRVYGATESLEGSIIRHSFRTARDVIDIGAEALAKIAVPKERPSQVDAILEAIDKASARACTDYIKYVIPEFDDDLIAATRRLTTGVFAIEDIPRIEEEIGYSGLIDRLYSRGLVGLPTDGQGSTPTLKFKDPDGNEDSVLTISNSANENVELQDIVISAEEQGLSGRLEKDSLGKGPQFGALHPALSAWICSSHSRDLGFQDGFNNAKFLVGYDLPCPNTIHDSFQIRVDLTKKEAWVLCLTKSDGSELTLMLTYDNAVLQTVQKSSSTFYFMETSHPLERIQYAVRLVSYLCTIKRQLLDVSISKENIEKEYMFLEASRIIGEFGLLPITDELKRRIEHPFLRKNKGREDVKLNSELRKIGLSTRLNTKVKNTLSICWTDQLKTSPRSWPAVKHDELFIRVRAKRVALCNP